MSPLGLRRPIRPAHSVAAVVLVLGFLLSACGGDDGFTYVSSTDRKAYFKVPAGWTYFDKREILVGSGQSLSEETDTQIQWLIGYDAAPEPSLDHVINKNAIPRYPVVFAQAQVLPRIQRDQLSLMGIRNYYYQVDPLRVSNVAHVISEEDVVLPGGFHGTRLIYYLIPGGAAAIASGGAVLRVDQTGIVDAGTNTLYFFVVRCESHCYRDNKTVIDQIAESWTVKER